LIHSIASKSTTTYRNTGLDPGSTYTYKVSAEDTNGNEGEKSDAVSKTLPIPPQNALQFRDFDTDYLYPSTWTQDYLDWLNIFQVSKAATGYFPGNVMGACFQPIKYKYDGDRDLYELSYILSVRGETYIGGGPLGHSFPEPWLDDNYELYDIPAPMFVKKIGIRTTLLPNDGITAQLEPSTILSIREAAQAALLGYYSPEIGSVTVENLVYDGQFKYLPYSETWWNKFGDGTHGSINFGSSYGHVEDGVLLYNDDDGIVSLCSGTISDNVQGEGNVLVNYWGKRISSDVGNEVGVKLIITYYDGSTQCIFPEELQMTHRDGIWHNYQYSVPYYGDIESIVIILANNELGSAYFDQVYVTAGWWECNEIGNWAYGSITDTYDEFLIQMELALTFAQYKYLLKKIIANAKDIADATGWSFLGDLANVAGFFMGVLDVDIPNFNLEGSSENDYSCYWEYIHHTTDENGDLNYVLGIDDMMKVNFDITPEDFRKYHGKIQLLIDVDISWGYCGDPTYLNEVSWYHNAGSTSLQFIIDITNLEW